jgi:hypothetical protein
MYSFSKHARSLFLKKTDHKKRKPRPQADGAFPPYYNLRGATPLERSRTGRKTCKPNFVECDHSSRRRVTADVQQRPTRRFQPLHGAALRRRADAGHTHCSERVPPSLFGLAPCGVYPAFGVAVEAVRSYRTFSPLPRGLAVQACALSVRPLAARNPKIALGVRRYILCGTRHPRAFTSSRSGRYPAHCPAEFGLSSPESETCAPAPAAIAQPSCQGLVYQRTSRRTLGCVIPSVRC